MNNIMIGCDWLCEAFLIDPPYHSSIPMNVDFTLHRNGEWTMLMLGESILSILIVDFPEESPGFNATFYSAVITTILLQYLHFQSQPNKADQHALRRHKDAGVTWHVVQHIYSFAFVSLGASFTFFLTDASFAAASNSGEGHRLLEGAATTSYDSYTMRSTAAVLFSGSLAVIFFCLDSMILLHLGVNEAYGRCVCKETKTKNTKGMGLVLIRGAILVFTATLFLWQTQPEFLSVIAVACTLLQLLTRRLGGKYLSHDVHGHHDDDGGDAHDAGEAKWPNVTNARVEHQA